MKRIFKNFIIVGIMLLVIILVTGCKKEVNKDEEESKQEEDIVISYPYYFELTNFEKEKKPTILVWRRICRYYYK